MVSLPLQWVSTISSPTELCRLCGWCLSTGSALGRGAAAVAMMMMMTVSSRALVWAGSPVQATLGRLHLTLGFQSSQPFFPRTCGSFQGTGGFGMLQE